MSVAEAALRPLRRQFPTIDRAAAEIARLSGELTLPKPTIHVISDVHGEAVKLRHVINNASGTLRPLVERLCAANRTPEQLEELIRLVFYPVQTLEWLRQRHDTPREWLDFARRSLRDLFALLRRLAAQHTLTHAERLFPSEFGHVFRELLHEPYRERGADFFAAVVESLARHDRVDDLIHLTVRSVRNLAIDELVIAGDCWDRGPRGDQVLEYLRRQPRVSFVWGNHDVSWLGAGLGSEALIATVLRISLRYNNLAQLEEGYGIALQPLEKLVAERYADDPAAGFLPKKPGPRDPASVARMQKAAAILQFKLEGQLIARNPWMGLDHRRLLPRLDLAAGTVAIDGKRATLVDRHFPTVDPDRPEELDPAERDCLDRLKHSFVTSPMLWEHLRFLVDHGTMRLLRDDHLIIHGCVPVDESGAFLTFPVGGVPRAGVEMYEAIEGEVVRALREPTDARRDLLWYLWCGPHSPLFGKDRIVTFESDFVREPEFKVETKNAFFALIHEADFCRRVLKAFGADPARGLIVNGHVPVKIEEGESPVKRSGMAITIDGAFSEAYGDHGYTLVLDPERTTLARHHHFESVDKAVREGLDIVPSVTTIREWDRPRRLADTERGAAIRADIGLLEALVDAYRDHRLRAWNPS